MVRIPPNKIQEEIDQEENEFYGTGYTEGDHENFDSTKDMVKAVTGNAPDPEKDGFEMAEEIATDEKALRQTPPPKRKKKKKK